MFGLGAGEVVIILVLAFLLIGPKKLPQLAQSMGRAIREFQKAKDEIVSQIDLTPEEKAANKESSAETNLKTEQDDSVPENSRPRQ